MKKHYLIIISVLAVATLGVGVYQYVKTFQTEIVGATSTTPNPGHTWAEMECNSDTLCINATNKKVGIGTETTTTSKKLEVGGDIHATGDVCNGSGKCLNSTSGTNLIVGTNPGCPAGQAIIAKLQNDTWYSALATTWTQVICGASMNTDGTTSLIYNLHSGKNCTDLNGTVVSDADGYFCRLPIATTCPSGWTIYKDWHDWVAMTTGSSACQFGLCCYPQFCTTGSGWQNGPYTCNWSSSYGPHGEWFGGCNGFQGVTSQWTAVGCY